jgi:hypothetical protein
MFAGMETEEVSPERCAQKVDAWLSAARPAGLTCRSHLSTAQAGKSSVSSSRLWRAPLVSVSGAVAAVSLLLWAGLMIAWARVLF